PDPLALACRALEVVAERGELPLADIGSDQQRILAEPAERDRRERGVERESASRLFRRRRLRSRAWWGRASGDRQQERGRERARDFGRGGHESWKRITRPWTRKA